MPKSSLTMLAHISRAFLFRPVIILVVALIAGCDSGPDTAYISDVWQFTKACTSCKPCKPGSASITCVAEGEKCEPLCPGGKSIQSGLGAGFVCHCTEEDNFWIFDTTTNTVNFVRMRLSS